MTMTFFRIPSAAVILSCLMLCSCVSMSADSNALVLPRPATPGEIAHIKTQVYESIERQQGEQTAPEPLEGRDDLLMYQPEYKPEYLPNPDKTRIVEYGCPQGVIRQVAFLDNDTDESAIVEASRTAKPDELAIVPELKEQGAGVLAAHAVSENGDGLVPAWRPPTARGPWPANEYLADGGDKMKPVYVEEDWTVHNLEIEDTVAHFDTLDGRTLVEPSNRVHLYAPRFGSVRKVEGIYSSGQVTVLSEARMQAGLEQRKHLEKIGFTAQETQTGFARTRHRLGGVGARAAIAGTDSATGLLGTGNYEAVLSEWNVLQGRMLGSAELLYLAEGALSARAWQGEEGVQVRIGQQVPMAAVKEEGAESIFVIKEDESRTSKLRLVKVASKKSAQPGDLVEFTLRFDNVGTEPIGNVTILDNLTTRLEFLPGSAESSLESGFVVQPNEGGSFTLRFEITDPLLPGEFGIVKFHCRVR